MDAIKGLLNNEQGFLAILLLIASTVFVGLGKMTVAEWQTNSEWIFGTWGVTHGAVAFANAVGSKTPATATTDTKPAS